MVVTATIRLRERTQVKKSTTNQSTFMRFATRHPGKNTAQTTAVTLDDLTTRATVMDKTRTDVYEANSSVYEITTVDKGGSTNHGTRTSQYYGV